MRRWVSTLRTVGVTAGLVASVCTSPGVASAAIAPHPAAAASANSQTPIYLNASYSPTERAVDLVSRMSLAEKAAQMNSSRAPSIPRLGVADWGWWNEANHGVNALTLTPTGNATTIHNTTSYPSDLSMGSTWDKNLVFAESGLIGDEARDVAPNNTQNLDFYAPTVNLSRDPRWGRNDESWSEDPLLTAGLASQYVDGLQGQTQQGVLPKSANGYVKAIATLKHYAANNSEVNRLNGNSVMDQRSLHEYYTAQFASIIAQAHPGSIMSSYNEVNGTPAAASVQLIDTMARQTFGFNGYFTSDCDAVYEIQNGHKWQPPQASAPLDQYGRAAFANSAGEDLDCNAGYSDQYSYGNTIPTAIAQKIQTQTDVYNVGDVDTSVVRLFAARISTGEFDAESQVPWVQAARTRLGGTTWVDSDANQAITETPARLAEARTAADESLVLLKNNGVKKANGSTGNKMLPLKVPTSGAYKVAVMGYFANPTGGVITGGYSAIQSAAGQAKEINAYQGIKAAVQAADPAATVDFLPGVTGGTTAASLTTVDQASIAAAKNYDAVIVVAGTDSTTSAEDKDRTTLDLPGAQNAMISAAEAANPHTVVYLETVGEVNLAKFASTTSALLWSSYNGEEQGAALADVLLGKVSPGGRLPFTWYKDESQIAPITDYAIRPTATNPGRTYQYFTGTPSYAFGYGLGYTTFKYSDITVGQTALKADGTVTVKAKVTNVGTATGSEVAQLYVSTPFEPAAAQRPIKRLEGFDKVTLEPGQSRTVSFSVKASSLAFWNEKQNKYVLDPGAYGLQVGASSSDIKLRASVAITGKILQTPAVVTAKPVQSGDKAAQVAQRVTVDINQRIDPQLTVSMADQSLYGYITKGQSKPLPVGLTVDYRSNKSKVVAVSNGRLKAVGSGIATITATVRLNGVSKSTTFTVDVAPLQFTSNPGATLEGGKPGSFTVTTNSSPAAKLSVSGTLPAGVTFTDNGDGTATIAGTPPSRDGVYAFVITARNGVGRTVQQTFVLYVGKQPAFTSSASATFVVGKAGSTTISTSGFPAATLTETGSLPAGVTFTDNGDGTATLAGTPAVGTQSQYRLALDADNGLTPATQTLKFTVLKQAPVAGTAVVAGATTMVADFGSFHFNGPRQRIAVHLVHFGTTTDAVAPITTGTDGYFEFDGVAPGKYQVEFVDLAGLDPARWYNGATNGSPAQSGASPVTLAAGHVRVDVDAAFPFHYGA